MTDQNHTENQGSKKSPSGSSRKPHLRVIEGGLAETSTGRRNEDRWPPRRLRPGMWVGGLLGWLVVAGIAAALLWFGITRWLIPATRP